MIAIRHKCFETNSSSESSFSHSVDDYVLGLITFVVKVRSDRMTEEKEKELQGYVINWLSSEDYASNVKLVSSQLVSNEDDIYTYRISISGKYIMRLEVFIQQFFSHGYGYEKEPDRYYVGNYETKITKNCKKITESLLNYLDKNQEDINFIVIDITNDTEQFDSDELDAHIWDDDDYDDYPCY